MKSTQPIKQQNCYTQIKTILEEARNQIYKQVNFIMVRAYWNIGRIIVEEEQQGKNRADYGKNLLKNLSTKLITDFGRGFDCSNLWNMRKFYLTFPILDALHRELSWTHYRLLLKIDNENARNFYLQECAKSHWSTRELERQINSMLFERLTISEDKIKVKQLAENGQIIESAKDAIKDPHILKKIVLKNRYLAKMYLK